MENLTINIVRMIIWSQGVGDDLRFKAAERKISYVLLPKVLVMSSIIRHKHILWCGIFVGAVIIDPSALRNWNT